VRGGFAAAEERVVLAVPQPSTTNHKGGTIAFGPDGMLYMGFGDGGGSGDPSEFAQNRGTLLGKMIRIDVGFSAFTDGYRIPSDNRFVGTAGVLPEIWSIGFRNPFRFGFDRQTGHLYIGDVGENSAAQRRRCDRRARSALHDGVAQLRAARLRARLRARGARAPARSARSKGAAAPGVRAQPGRGESCS
jgi:hypothetical protein